MPVSKLAIVPAVVAGLMAEARSAKIHVSPAGTATAAASSASSPTSYANAFAAAGGGDTVLLAAGTYTVGYTSGSKNTLVFSKAATQGSPIVVQATGGRAVFDFSFPEDSYVQDSYGFYVTGSWWVFSGIDITRAGYQGSYVTGSHNTFTNCTFHDNRNSGLEINKGGSYTTVVDCDSYRNYDPKKLGTMSDGFASKQLQGPGNNFHGCRAWANSDDGWDTFASSEAVVLDSCWTWANGYHQGKAVGNGNGFKLGGDDSIGNDVARHCVSYSNLARGFDQNNNRGGVTLINCTAFKNGTQNYSFGGSLASGEKNVFTNNLSYLPGSSDVIANAMAKTNSWNLPVTVSLADFLSLDTSLGPVVRAADGSLPRNSFLALAASSDLIDAGTAAGYAFGGAAPDLGAFERAASTPISVRPNRVAFTASLSGGMLRISGLAGAGVGELRSLTGSKVRDLDFVDLGSGSQTSRVGELPGGVYRLRIPGTGETTLLVR